MGKKAIKMLIKIVCNLIIVVLALVFLLALSYFLHGSMEMNPTEEQQDKVRVVMGCLMAASGIPCAVIVGIRVFLGSRYGRKQ